MKSDILLAIILAAPALAAPKYNLVARTRNRDQGRNSPPAGFISEGVNVVVGAGDNLGVKYSTNWAGAALERPPRNATFSVVSATFTVPEPATTKGDNGMHGVSAWVGIDGDTYKTTILQAGVDATVKNGRKSYHPWYEWYPDNAHDFDLEVGSGDVIAAQVHALSPSQGVAILENQSNGQSVTKTLNAPAPTATLEGKNAEWIVEDFETNGDMIGLVDFYPITFTGAQALAGSSSYGVSGATIMEMVKDGLLVTQVNKDGDSGLVVKHV